MSLCLGCMATQYTQFGIYIIIQNESSLSTHKERSLDSDTIPQEI